MTAQEYQKVMRQLDQVYQKLYKEAEKPYSHEIFFAANHVAGSVKQLAKSLESTNYTVDYRNNRWYVTE